MKKQAEEQHQLMKQKTLAPLPKGVPPKILDWLKQGKVSTMKCQGCEDCWAFAVAGAMEASLMIREHPSTEPNISEQALVDCSNAGTCKEWGYWGRALQYVLNNPLPDEEHYPYTHSDSPCKPAGRSALRNRRLGVRGGERRRCLRGHAKTSCSSSRTDRGWHRDDKTVPLLQKWGFQ